jgi:hypothetical protein
MPGREIGNREDRGTKRMISRYFFKEIQGFLKSNRKGQ